MGLRRSADWDRFGAVEEGKEVDTCVEFEERESKGDWNLLEVEVVEEEEEEEEVVVVVVVVVVEVEVVEGEGDMYLEETCRPLGLRGFGFAKPLSFSEGRRGGL